MNPERANALKNLHATHPWPSARPPQTLELDGWLAEDNKELFRTILGDDTQLVVELGSWVGLSARFFCELAPNATVACVDTWEGNVEHKIEYSEEIPYIESAFLHHLWPHRERVVPMRMLSWDGLKEIHDLGLEPDVIYIDASHTYEDAFRDMDVACTLFPTAQIVADDWMWHSVFRAAVDVARKHGLRIEAGRHYCRFVPSRGFVGVHLLAVWLRRLIQIIDGHTLWPIVRRLRKKSDPYA